MGKEKIIITTPGRINLIGEHTDYNDGFALPGAIDRHITVVSEATGGNELTVIARELEEEVVTSIDDPKSLGGWTAYPVGIVKIAKEMRLPIGGFNAKIKSTIPIGSGLSSSAALLCGMIRSMQGLFGWQLSPQQIAAMAQQVEQETIGVECGMMDQMACMMSRKDHLMLLDCRDHSYQHIPVVLPGHEMVLLNTNIRHDLSDSEYNNRRAECAETVQLLKKYLPEANSLRDVSLPDLLKYQNTLPKYLFNRAHHVITENARTLETAKYIAEGNLTALGEAMYASHRSLQHQYEVSSPELDFLVDYTKNTESVLGARMMGGGFGGCTINLINAAEKDGLIECLTEDYFNEFGLDMTVLTVRLSDGMFWLNDV